MTPDEAVAACREAGVRLVRFLYCDNGGIVRAKAATWSVWPTGCGQGSV